MDVGIVGFLFVVLPAWAAALLVLYWVVRLGVRHGTLDAYRIDRTDQRIAAMQADLGGGRTPAYEPDA